MSGLFSSCEGHVEILLESLWANRAVSRVRSGNSVFQSGSDRDLGLFIKVQLGSQASSGVEAWNSAFLSSCPRGVRAHSSLCGEFGLFLQDQHGRQASHPVVRRYLLFHWSQCMGIRTYLKLRGHSVSFFLEVGSVGFHSRFNR